MFGKTSDVIVVDGQLRQGIEGIKKISNIQHQIDISDKDSISIDIGETEFISPAFIPIIASFPRLELNNKRVKIIYNPSNRKMYDLLTSQGVFSYYNNTEEHYEQKDVIEFTCIQDKNEAIPILIKIFELAPIKLKKDARDVLFSSLYEIFDNALTHSKSNLGAFCGGKWEKRKKQLTFSVYDHGIGIPKNVNNYLKRDLNTKESMNWAFVKGNSTSDSDYPRGLGFSRLESFVNANDGKITICSGDGILIIKKNGKRFEKMDHELKGTLFIMNIRADDEHIYVLK